MPPPAQLRQLEARADKLIRRQTRGAGVDFSRYHDDPVGFFRDVLGDAPYDKQCDIADAVRDCPQVSVRSANGQGKDWTAARIALWWVYCRKGLAILTGPTDRQVKTVLMGEIGRAFYKAKLPGELFQRELRMLDQESHAGILAFTSNETDKLIGFHAPNLLVIVTEAQGVEDSTWEAMWRCLTGDAATQKALCVGNPTISGGRFHKACKSPTWRSLKLTAFDHPNVQQDRELIPGGTSRAFIQRMRDEFGEHSPIYRSCVLAEFPEADLAEVLCARAWLEKADELFRSGALEDRARNAKVVFALDPARGGPDKSALALREGPVLREFKTWRRADTMTTTGRVITTLRDRGIHPRDHHYGPGIVAPEHTLVVDGVGLGGGIVDRLREVGWSPIEFNGSAPPLDQNRFLNTRAESFWHLRRQLELGLIAIPFNEALTEELCETRWKPDSAGRIKLEPKEELRDRLGRSPDLADATSMAFAVGAVIGAATICGTLITM